MQLRLGSGIICDQLYYSVVNYVVCLNESRCDTSVGLIYVIGIVICILSSVVYICV